MNDYLLANLQWQKEKNILGTELQIRVGGSFVWPPPGIDINQIKRVVLVAGGVGIKYVLHTRIMFHHYEC